jgi:prephenate dehydratase
VTVGFQGETGAFSEAAAFTLCGSSTATRGFASFDALLAAAASGAIDAAILPVENSIAGQVREAVRARETFSMLHQLDAIDYPIAQCLVGLRGAATGALEAAFSHPVALAQCGRFFARHPHIKPLAMYDTAAAVRDIVHGANPRHAAVASAHAAAIYGASVLEQSIQDAASNRTRFLLLALDEARRP